MHSLSRSWLTASLSPGWLPRGSSPALGTHAGNFNVWSTSELWNQKQEGSWPRGWLLLMTRSSTSAPYLVVSIRALSRNSVDSRKPQQSLSSYLSWLDWYGDCDDCHTGNRPMGRRKTRPGCLPVSHIWRTHTCSWWTERRILKEET